MHTNPTPTPSHADGELCPPRCDACVQQEYMERDMELRVEEQRLCNSDQAWRTAVGDLPELRGTLAGAVSVLVSAVGLGLGSGYWSGEPDDPNHVEEQIRFKLFDVPPEDRVILERLARDLYRAQVRVLAQYAAVDQLTPEVRTRVADILADEAAERA
jgi:hypothetical protein